MPLLKSLTPFVHLSVCLLPHSDVRFAVTCDLIELFFYVFVCLLPYSDVKSCSEV